MKIFSIKFIFIAALYSPVYAQDFIISDIFLDGLQRISAGVVFGLLPVGQGDLVDSRTPGQIVRALSASGYFEDIEVARDGTVLHITVLERPSVSQITISGNKVLKTEDILDNMESAEISEGQIFTRSTLEAIRQGIQEVYSSRGRYGATVEIEVLDQARNRVSIDMKVNEGKESRIKHINIVGNTIYSDEELLDLFELGLKPWYMFFSGKDKYSREQLSGDLERLSSYYLDTGYVEFTIDSTPISITPDKKEVYITINVNEGNKFTVAEVDLAGDLVDLEGLLRAYTFVRTGQTFSQSLITSTEEFMTQILGNQGYAFAEVTGVPDVNEEDRTVDITFFIEPGNRTYVNRISFIGNISTADEVLRREMRQLESAPASSLQIEQSKVNLQRLGYFNEVEVETIEVAGTSDQIDVDYTVQETSYGQVQFTIGSGGGGDFFINTSLQNHNFLGTGKTISISFLKSRFQDSINLGYLDPYYTPDGGSRGFNIFLQKVDSPFNIASFNTTSYGGKVNFGYRISDLQRLGFDFGFTHTELSAGDTDSLFGNFSVQEILATPKLISSIDRYLISPANANPFDGPVVDAVTGNVFDLPLSALNSNEPGFIDREGDTFDNFSITGNWQRNTLNRGQLATDGSFQTLGLEVTLPGSDLQYYKLNYISQYYMPLTRGLTLAFNTNLGYGGGYGGTRDMPFFSNFFAGGLSRSGIVRGFEENSLGPRTTDAQRYLLNSNITLIKDDNGNILRNFDGSARGFNQDFAYSAIPILDVNGNQVLDSNGNPAVQLAVENIFSRRVLDAFGGNIMVTGSVELLFSLPFVKDLSRVRSALFIDAGNVFSSNCTERQQLTKNCSNFDIGELRYSIGFSITYLSPFGPLTMYVAAPFSKDDEDDTKTFDFTIGTTF